MGGFEGWWVNSITGKGHHVAEHWMEVKGDPERYGLTEPQVDNILQQAGGKFNPGDTSPDSARGLLLIAAMKHGWVRVRGYRGQYSIQVYGKLASRLPKVLKFLKQAGVGPYSTMVLSDLATDFHQKYNDGMHEVHRVLKQGKIPDVDGPVEQPRLKGLREPISKGFPAGMDDKQMRVLMRQRLGQKTHVPDPDAGDDKIEENKGKAFARGMKRLLG
jgi:hypothetical protein